VLTGSALTFVFTPNATLMMTTISNKEMGNAAGLSNMLRNIGGSIGIAMASTALVRRSAFHQANLGANLGPSSYVLQQKSAAVAGYLGRHGPPGSAHGSLGQIYGLMQQQSALLAYVDVFRWTAILAFGCAAAAWLFKKPIRNAAPRPGEH
jgi:DHA2 family multidrug resistance protein